MHTLSSNSLFFDFALQKGTLKGVFLVYHQLYG